MLSDTPLQAPTTTGDTAEQTLLAVLNKINAMQNQPIVPDNPLAQIGAALAGFGAGVQGKANPVLAQFRADREMQMQGLAQQATIANALSSLENTRATRAETQRHHRATEEKAEKDYALRVRDFAQKNFTEFSKHADPAVRLHAFKSAQETGLLPKELDAVAASAMAGPDFETKHDQVLSIVVAGGNPFDKALYGERYPVNVFGPVVMQAQRSMQQPGGAMALNEHRFKKESPETVMKARYAVLNMRDADSLTNDEQREKASIEKVLKIGDEASQTQVERLATTLEKEDAAAGKPKKARSAYIDAAAEIFQDKESVHREITKEAERKGLKGAARYEFIRNETISLNAARAAATQDATRLPERERAVLTVLDQGQEVLRRLTTEFSLEERKKYAGWFNYKGRQLQQAIAADPKFAQFRALINQGKSMAFSDGGKNLTQYEGGITFGWVPTGEELSAVDFEEKMKLATERLEFTRRSIVNNAVTPSKGFRAPEPTPTQPTTPSGTPFRFKRLPDGRVLVED